MTQEARIVPREVWAGTAALVFLLVISSVHFLLGLLATLFLPLPLLYLRIKTGRKAACLVAAGVWASYVLLAPVPGPLKSFLFLGMPMLLGLFLGEFLTAGYFIGRSIAFSVGATLGVLGLLILVIPSWGSPGVSSEEFQNRFLANMDAAFESYGDMGLIPREQVPEFQASAKEIAGAVFRVFPALLIIGTTITAWASLLAAKKLKPFQEIFDARWDRLKEWQAPEYLIWGVIAAGCTLLLPAPGVRTWGLNLLLVLLLVYFFQGFSIVVFYMDRKEVPRFLRGFVYAFILLQELATILVVTLGILDVWFDLRRIKKNLDPLNERG